MSGLLRCAAPPAQMLDDFAVCWDELRPLLAEQGIHFLEKKDYTPDVHVFLKQHFSTTICPVLTPLAFDPGHPFPYISNRSRNLAVVVRHRHRTKFARVKVPHTLPRFIELPRALTGGIRTFVFLEDVIKANLQELFPGVDIVSAHLFRVIRDTDIVVREGETDDLLESVDREPQTRPVWSRLAPRGRERHAEARAGHPDGELRSRRGCRLEIVRSHRVRRLAGDRTAASARIEGCADRLAYAVAARRQRSVRAVEIPGLPAASPVRFIHVRRDVHQSRRPRPERHRDQDDVVPDRQRFTARRSADRSGGRRKAGGGARGVESPIRRAKQYRMGQPARRGGRSCRVRPAEPEDALQGVSGGPPGPERRRTLRPHRRPAITTRSPRRSTPILAC